METIEKYIATSTNNQQNQNITINRVIEVLPTFYKDKGFSNFEADGKLAEKKQICINFAKGRLDKKSMVLCGKVGNGKTHLAVAIAKNFTVNKKLTTMNEVLGRVDILIKLIDADELFMTLNDLAVTGKSKIEYIKNLLRNDLIILDDLGIANFTPAKQENLYVLINKCYQENHPIIITTNFTMEQLEKVDARIPSRLNEMATILSFEFNDHRIKK